MKITTWNVNGYRAVLTKGFREWVIENNPDILCLQEIKARPEQVEESNREFEGYQSYWNPAQRPGYSGVATYLRQQAISTSFGLGDDRFDDEGRVIRTDYADFSLFNVYFPNGQRGQERVDYKLQFYEKLLELCDDLHALGKGVIITGDFNTSHREIDLANPKENQKTSGFLPEERVWIDKYLEHGFIDAFRYLYPESVQYTWWTYRFGARGRNIGWRLDYYLVSKSLIDQVEDVIVFDKVLGSDHCPVSLVLK